MHYLAKTSLIAKRFSADFLEIKLTQLDSSSPLIISGVGTICQDNFGSLQLKIFQKDTLDTKKVLEYQEEKSGGKFSTAGGCGLHAVTYSGDTWTCDYVKTREFLSIGSSGCVGVFSAKVIKLESSQGSADCFQRSWFEGIIPFELELPFYLGADGKRNSYPERMLKFTFNKVTKVELMRCDGYTSIKISNKFELVSDRLIEVIAQALSVATGRAVKFIWRQIGGEQFHHNVISEFDFELSRTALPPPIDLHYGRHFLSFLEVYIEFGLRNDHNYFGYWEKLHSSWASGLVVAALPLSVYIEGVMKEFYSEFMAADAQLVEDVNLTAKAVEGLIDIDAKVKERMCNRIRGSAKGTVTNGLRALAQRGCIDDHLVASWKFVRHRSAHGNDFTLDQVAKIQQVVTSIYSCLELFYELLNLKLDISCHRVRYSKIGFPTEFRFANRFKLSKK